jgi:Delta24-sterol reductase
MQLGQCGLGIVTAIELQLIDATKFVEARYYPVSGVAEATRKIQGLAKSSDLDYLDGILFSLHQGVIVTGRMTNDVPTNLAVRQFSRSKPLVLHSCAGNGIKRERNKPAN